MDQEQRLLDLVSLQVGAHVDVGVSRLPQGPLLSLETKWRQCPAQASSFDAWCHQQLTAAGM